MRYKITMDVIVEAHNKEEAERKTIEKGGTVVKIEENPICVGDIVTITKPGQRYSTYDTFFEQNNLPIGIAARYCFNGCSLSKGGRYKVISIGKHECGSEPPVAVIEDVNDCIKSVYLISIIGIETVC